jgi:hypothetical protein
MKVSIVRQSVYGLGYMLLVAAIYIFVLWLAHAVVAALLSLPVVLLGRHRVCWRRWELLAFVAPFCVWLALPYCLYTPSNAKGWDNLIEPLYFSIAVPVAALVRVAIGKRINETFSAAGLIGVLCIVATLVYLLTPNLGGSLG